MLPFLEEAIAALCLDLAAKHLPAGNTSDILGGPQGSVAMAPSRSILPGEIERGERERGRERERERERRERERESLVMAYYQRESLIPFHIFYFLSSSPSPLSFPFIFNFLALISFSL